MENTENKENEDQIAARLKEMFDEKRMGADLMEVADKVGNFADVLRKKYPASELNTCRMFHLLAGSSEDPSKPFQSFDLSGEDSIQKFIEGL